MNPDAFAAAGQPVGQPLGQPLVLPVVMDGLTAEPLRQAILQRRGQPLSLDGANVERIGGLGLQVLIAAAATWQADGQPLAFAAPSAAMTEQLAAFGYDPNAASTGSITQ